MIEHHLRIIIEKVSVSSQEVVQRDTLQIYDINSPKSILELGLRHAEQISLLEKVQNALLAEQAILIESENKVCPKCEQKIRKNGYRSSGFHAVFSDHQIRIQKHICTNPACNWSSSPTVNSLFGTNTHPDLAKIQCEQGALYSFREAQKNLERLNHQSRSINNPTQIKRMAGKVGEILSQRNAKQPTQQDCTLLAGDLLVQVERKYLPIKDKNKRRFEALSAIIYQPERIKTGNKKSKSYVVSTKEDHLKTIKTFVLNASMKQGLGLTTVVTGLADGAKNCWSVLWAIEPYCQTLERILDWFHVDKKFQNMKQRLGESFEASLEYAKWELWQGNAAQALTKLLIIKEKLQDEKKKIQLQKLYDYLHRNQNYLVNYEQRQQAQQIYTSQVAETRLNSLINARYKTGKRQWTSEAAHQILQIRAMMASDQWEREWQEVILSALGARRILLNS